MGSKVTDLAEAVATTRASVDGLVQTIAEASARSEARLSRLEDNEARLNRLEDAVVGIEQILERLTRPGQTHLNLPENIRWIFNFTLPYA